MNKFERTLEFILSHIREDSPFYGKIYLVGGCVRDEYLGKRYSDLDLLINIPNGQKHFVEHMCNSYPDVCKGPFFYKRYGTTAMDVIINHNMTLVECVEPHIEQYDIDGKTLIDTQFCSLEEDALRRDYTCNALYKNLHTGEILDPTGMGFQDLDNKILRTPNVPDIIYLQDPIRMLRGIRFKYQKGFLLEKSAEESIIKNHEELRLSLPKRIKDELYKILKTDRVGEAIEELQAVGLLPFVMPGYPRLFTECKTFLWQHTFEALHSLTTAQKQTDILCKLVILTLHYAEEFGINTAKNMLLNSQISKDKTNSTIHLCQMYFRYRSFFSNREYIAKPKALPRFIKGLNRFNEIFRQIVCAFNAGLSTSEELPYNNINTTDANGNNSNSKPNEILYKYKRKKREIIEKTIKTETSMSFNELEKQKRHRRNIKRREQRKRAKVRKREAIEKETLTNQ